MVFCHGRCPVRLWLPNCQRAVHLRGRLGALLLIAQMTCLLCGPSLGVGIQSGKRYNQFSFNKEQLTVAEK